MKNLNEVETRNQYEAGPDPVPQVQEEDLFVGAAYSGDLHVNKKAAYSPITGSGTNYSTLRINDSNKMAIEFRIKEFNRRHTSFGEWYHFIKRHHSAGTRTGMGKFKITNNWKIWM